MFRSSGSGYSLIELVIVVLIVGIVAVVAIPFLSTANEKKLQLAAEEIATAMRFSRTESIRLGAPLGFKLFETEQRMRVFNADFSTATPTLNYDVYHPVSKQNYDVKLQQHAFAQVKTVSLDSAFYSTCNETAAVYFNQLGMPLCLMPKTATLDYFSVDLRLGSYSRLVTVHGITGRVTIQ